MSDNNDQAFDDAVAMVSNDVTDFVGTAMEASAAESVAAAAIPRIPPPTYTRHPTDPTVEAGPAQPTPKPLGIEPFELEHGKAQPTTNGPMEKLKRRAKRYSTGLCSGLGGALGVILIVLACCIPDALYVVYAYYFDYGEIFFNSTIAMHIYANDNTENAFKVFYWFLALLCVIPNAIAGWGFAMIGYGIAKACRLPCCLMVLWMIPWVFSGFAIKTATLWGRTTAEAVWQQNVWDTYCAANDWDFDIAIAASSVSEMPLTLPIVVTGNITSTTSATGYNFTAELSRHSNNYQRFDFEITGQSGHIDLPFTIITYDSQNMTYNATRDSKSRIPNSRSHYIRSINSLPSTRLLGVLATIGKPGQAQCNKFRADITIYHFESE